MSICLFICINNPESKFDGNDLSKTIFYVYIIQILA